MYSQLQLALDVPERNYYIIRGVCVCVCVFCTVVVTHPLNMRTVYIVNSQ